MDRLFLAKRISKLASEIELAFSEEEKGNRMKVWKDKVHDVCEACNILIKKY